MDLCSISWYESVRSMSHLYHLWTSFFLKSRWNLQMICTFFKTILSYLCMPNKFPYDTVNFNFQKFVCCCYHLKMSYIWVLRSSFYLKSVSVVEGFRFGCMMSLALFIDQTMSRLRYTSLSLSLSLSYSQWVISRII